MEIKKYSEKGLENVKSCNFLQDEDWKALEAMNVELQDTFEKKQLWRTETEMRVSVLNDIKFHTPAAKYWQCVREQSSYFESLITLSFQYKRNNVKIKRINENLLSSNDELDKEELEIDLEEALFAKKNFELEAKDRMRELKLWSKIKSELDDDSFDTKNVDTHQLVSYTQKFILESTTILDTGVSLTMGEATNLFGQTKTMLDECIKRNMLEKVLYIIPVEKQDKLMKKLGYTEVTKLK